MRFVHLFCGIGGFHAALDRLGHECVFATDIDNTQPLFTSPTGEGREEHVHCDIRDVIDDIPEMDIICAGFPCCQPFSKSGSQDGFGDQTRGTLFHDICSLARSTSRSTIPRKRPESCEA